jgi:hypothetical protein
MFGGISHSKQRNTVLGVGLAFAVTSSILHKFSRFVAEKPLGSVAKPVALVFVTIAAIIGVIFLLQLLRIAVAMLLIGATK